MTRFPDKLDIALWVLVVLMGVLLVLASGCAKTYHPSTPENTAIGAAAKIDVYQDNIIDAAKAVRPKEASSFIKGQATKAKDEVVVVSESFEGMGKLIATAQANERIANEKYAALYGSIGAKVERFIRHALVLVAIYLGIMVGLRIFGLFATGPIGHGAALASVFMGGPIAWLHSLADTLFFTKVAVGA